MKNVFFIFLVLAISHVYAQDISGSWNWSSHDESDITEMVLIKVDSVNYKGNYCSVFHKVKKIDCSDESNVVNITISKMDKNVFVGSFMSSYSNTKGRLKLTYLETTSNLKLEITKRPKGKYYLQNQALFEK